MTTILYRDNPRIIAIRPPSNLGNTCLILKVDQVGNCIVNYSNQELPGYRLLYPRPIHGCIGIVAVNGELFVGVITDATRAADFEDHDIFCINRVMFYCISSSKYDRLSSETSQPVSTVAGEEAQLIHPCTNLIKLLCTGSFYFSHTFDVTRDLKSRHAEIFHNVIDGMNSDFVWNKSIMGELLRIKRQDLPLQVQEDINKTGILVPIMQGFVGLQNVMLQGQKWKVGIISRLSSNRAGTRFNARGINDDGHVSNFVETEFLIYCGQHRVSFIQLRGSIPLFWEQTGVQVSHKVKISRGLESTLHATKRHFEDLIESYSNVQIVNLLSQIPTSPEYELSMTYKAAVNQLPELHSCIRYYVFDFHSIVKRDQYHMLDDLATALRKTMSDFGFTLYNATEKTIVQEQCGVFRTNCLDCLDRTNVVQTLFAKEFLKTWLENLWIRLYGFEQDNMDTAFNNLWADNGDWLSKIYAGTGAIKSSYTRNGKQTLFGFLDDAAKSVNRFYVQNFQDKSRQEAIDLLLTNGPSVKTPGMDVVKQQLLGRIREYSTMSQLTLFCGTYNFNGKLPQGEPLLSWLTTNDVGLADIAVIGCQELIQLTAGEYISADTDKLRQIWEATFLEALNSLPRSDYVLLRSLHLVALGLFVFVRKGMTTRIREVEATSIKTGLMGMAANKGGIGLRMKVDDTTMAFVTAHFAAGQSMVDDRNRDYWTITNGLLFKSGRLLDHDMVFWFGDFNYRINGENMLIRQMVSKKQYEQLWKMDQLMEQKQASACFVGFQEGSLLFDPTYKYDNQSTFYDTSEKQRIPAWTDRILYKGHDIYQLDYNRGEQPMSDHRPVRSFFKIQVLSFDKTKKQMIEEQIRSNFSTKSLPPPSTDEIKWWETHEPRECPKTIGDNPFFDFPVNGGGNISTKPLINLMD